MSTWDTPPTEQELGGNKPAGGVFDSPPTPEELAAIEPGKPSPLSKARSLAMGARQGATFGFADEMGAVAQAMLQAQAKVNPGWWKDLTGIQELKNNDGSPKGILEAYREARGENRDEESSAKAANPGHYTAGEIGGAVLVPIPGPGKATGAAKLVKTLGSATAQGAAYGAGSSEASDMAGLAADTGLGAGVGLVGGTLGAGLARAGEAVVGGAGRLSKWATKKIEESNSKIRELAEDKLRKEAASLAGQIGGETQKGNRFIENLLRLEASGALSAEQKAQLAQLKASGVWDKLVSKLADSNLDSLPKQADVIMSLEREAAERAAGKQQLFEKAVSEIDDPMGQVMPRLKRYGPVWAASLGGAGLGGAVGLVAADDPLVGGLGALAGAGLRPSIHAVKRMAQHPAVQKRGATLVKALAEPRLPAVLKKAAGASAKGVPRGASVGTIQTGLGQREHLPILQISSDGYKILEPDQAEIERQLAIAEALSGR